MRLDKYLADMGIGTRKEVKHYIRKGFVTVEGRIVKSPETHIGENDLVEYRGEPVGYVEKEYYMLHKPAGVITAARDSRQETVLDLITDKKRKDLFPVGRLDKDTEGLLLITNDGELAHRLLSPRSHVGKVYYAKIQGKVTQRDVEAFREGLPIEEGFTALGATLEILTAGEISEIQVEIFEGKFHQVKRMFQAVGKEVLYLKRLSMGNLKLDSTLAPGEYRELTREEVATLENRQ